MDIPDTKRKALEIFISKLKAEVGDKLLGIYLFGSTAKGEVTPQSDIDVLVVYSDMAEEELLKVISDIGFQIACDLGELIEPVVMSKEEYESSLGSSPFLWEVLRFGVPLFTKLKGTEWKLDFKGYLKLAQEFLSYAEDALKDKKVRLAIDTGYNACELLVKALIISSGEKLASSHGGIVGQFGRLFVKTGKFEPEVGRNLNLSLALRARARYQPDATLEVSDAELVISLAKTLLSFAQEVTTRGSKAK